MSLAEKMGALAALPHELTTLDREESTRRGWNPYALGQYLRATADSAAAVRYECEHGRPDREGWVGAKGRGPILPDPVDVLYSLVSDASVLDYPTFEAWAGEWDFDPDSRRAEGIYRECLELALRLRGAVGEEGIRKLAEATEGY